MASPKSEFSYGSVYIYNNQVLGIGSYGKVVKAKCGQLPCAAKLLHETLFQDNDPGIHNLTKKFQQECQFLSTMKHPNIVQYLGTTNDRQSRRLVLLMELMDESLTKFLERSTGPLPYHTKLNICHDVALALAYLHSNDIVHRDLSSNNVLLIGEGSRAKVTDFGVSKLMSTKPRMTPLTRVPGTSAYMSPEALTTPPHYSKKLDCFSHGVLTLQIITRNFPNPGDATKIELNRRFSTGRVCVFIPEAERRKKDIDLVEPTDPLRPIVLHSLKDRETERPSADELCGRLASLKSEQMYTHSVEQTRGHLQELERERADHQGQLKYLQEKFHQSQDNERIMKQIVDDSRDCVLRKDEMIRKFQEQMEDQQKEFITQKVKWEKEKERQGELTSTIQRLRQENNRQRELVQTLQQDKMKWEKERDRLGGLASTIQRLQQDRDAQKTKWEKEMLKQKMEWDNQKRQIIMLTSKVQRLQQEKIIWEEEKVHQRELVQRLQQEKIIWEVHQRELVQRLQQEKIIWEEEIVHQRELVQSLQQERDTQNIEWKKEKERQGELTSTIHRLRQEKKRQRELVQTLQQDKMKWEKERDQLASTTMQRLRQEKIIWEEEIVHQRELVQSLQQERDTQNIEWKKEKERQGELTSTIQRLRQEKNRQRELVQTLQQDKMKWEKERDRLGGLASTIQRLQQDRDAQKTKWEKEMLKQKMEWTSKVQRLQQEKIIWEEEIVHQRELVQRLQQEKIIWEVHQRELVQRLQQEKIKWVAEKVYQRELVQRLQQERDTNIEWKKEKERQGELILGLLKERACYQMKIMADSTKLLYYMNKCLNYEMSAFFEPEVSEKPSAAPPSADPPKTKWRQGKSAPQKMSAEGGTAVVHGNTAYFGYLCNVYSYTVSTDKWTTLQPCQYEKFSLAVVNDRLTTIGGWDRKLAATNSLLSLSGEMWHKLLLPMPTCRVAATAATTPTHLVVAGGDSDNCTSLSTVEVLNTETLQWSTANSLPRAVDEPRMTLCGGSLYLSNSNDDVIFSCSVEDLLKSCKSPSSQSSAGGSVWGRLADIPVSCASGLATLRGDVLAIGGRNGIRPTGTIHCYNVATNSWHVIGEMPTPKSGVLTAVFPSNELMVVQGDTTEIGAIST